MEFYSAKYRAEKFSFGKWKETYVNGKFVVIAENLEEAIEKINICLKKYSSEKRRRVLISEVYRCDGIDFIEDDDSGRQYTSLISSLRENIYID